jgi:RNA polymerase sigma factor (sigma-70 family)
MAFGYALVLLRDFHSAEDATQEAFVAAWFSLAKLQDADAFPAWLRGIVRHQCHRLLRKRHLETVSRAQAEQVASSNSAPDQQLERKETLNRVFAVINRLSQAEREVTTLCYIQEYSQREIAAFLGVSLTTVNNRLHAARTKLKRRMLAMVKEVFKEHSLREDFSARVGKIVRVQGPVIEAQFKQDELPAVLSTLTVTNVPDEVTAEVAQCCENGIVRCMTTSPMVSVKPGAQIVSTQEPSRAPLSREVAQRAIHALGNPQRQVRRGANKRRGNKTELLETGIKVIDLLCPFIKGGKVGILGDLQVGKLVLIEELVHRVAAKKGGVTLFTFVQAAEVPVVQEAPAKEPSFTGGTRGAVQTFYLFTESPAMTGDVVPAGLDAALYFSRAVAGSGLSPAIDPRRAASRLLDESLAGAEHFETAQRVKELLKRAEVLQRASPNELSDAERLAVSRATKLHCFFSRPFFVAEAYTQLSGTSVRRRQTVRACRAILDGQCDAMSPEAFRFIGQIDEALQNASNRH